jgi:hypothetical protein
MTRESSKDGKHTRQKIKTAKKQERTGKELIQSSADSFSKL